MTHDRLMVLVFGRDAATEKELEFLKSYTNAKDWCIYEAEIAFPLARNGTISQVLAARAYIIYNSSVDCFY